METKAEIIMRKQKAANSLAKSKDYDRALYETTWNGYTIYVAILDSSTIDSCGGYPMYILISDSEAPRWATFEEVNEILVSL